MKTRDRKTPLFMGLGAEISEAEGSRVGDFFRPESGIHLPHPRPTTDKGAVEAIRKWLTAHLDEIDEGFLK